MKLFKNPLVVAAVCAAILIICVLSSGVNNTPEDTRGYFVKTWELIQQGNVFASVGFLFTLLFFASVLTGFVRYFTDKNKTE